MRTYGYEFFPMLGCSGCRPIFLASHNRSTFTLAPCKTVSSHPSGNEDAVLSRTAAVATMSVAKKAVALTRLAGLKP